MHVSCTVRSFPGAVSVASSLPRGAAERTADTDSSYTPSTSNVASVLAQHTSRNMNTAESNCKLDPVPDISPDGDVVLVVGPRNVRLRIQSQCLRCASKVFGAMFGPTWSEG
jgi:hypothetical protein